MKAVFLTASLLKFGLLMFGRDALKLLVELNSETGSVTVEFLSSDVSSSLFIGSPRSIDSDSQETRLFLSNSWHRVN